MAFTGVISHEGATEPPRAVIDEAVHCAEQVRAQRDALQAPRLLKAFELADGSQAYVLDMEHVWKIHIIPPFDHGVEGQPTEIEPIKILDEPVVTIAGMVSGGVTATALDFHTENPDNGRPWRGWYVVNDAVSLMPETAELFTRREVAYKVGVLENPIFAPFDRVLSENVFSQFATTEPGNYTGAMCSVVQLLLGVGKMLKYDYEQRWLAADPDTRSPLVLVTSDPNREEYDTPEVPTSFYSGTGLKELQISYDRHWNRTHGIMWGRNEIGKRVPMLVELGQRGIHVMPFPVDALSVLPDVQEHYKRVYPDLERFTPFWGGTAGLFDAIGGFPTGERMAGTPEEFERQVRAGWVIAADRDLGAFYSGVSMCTGFGWAFHDESPCAINTMYKYNELGQKVGFCYEVRLNITEKGESQKVRNPVALQLINVLGLTTDVDRYKAERIDQDTAEDLLQSEDYDAFDAYVVSPDWVVQAAVVELRQGVIDWPYRQCHAFDPCIPIGAPQFKYFEPLIGAMLHFEFEKAHLDVPNPQRADGPIFATYVDGTRDIIHYFMDHTAGSSSSTQINTRQFCQFVGKWSEGTISERAKISGHFYTSTRDFRRLWNWGHKNIRHTTGYVHANYDYMSTCAFFGSHFDIIKRWVGSEDYVIETNGGSGFRTAIACASNNRSVYFVVDEESENNAWSLHGRTGELYVGSSGTVKFGSIYNFIFHWTGFCATDNHPEFGRPACHLNVSDPIVDNPNACMGLDEPITPRYVVCCVNDGKIGGCFVNSDIIIESPSIEGFNSIIYSAAITRPPTLPPAWSAVASTPEWRYKYNIRAYGHPLMHDQIIHEYEEVVTDGQSVVDFVSWSDWWRCSIPGSCAAYPWRVAVNYYGPPYIATTIEWGFGWVEFGVPPQVNGRYFGVVH
jgi:hypothetical protein